MDEGGRIALPLWAVVVLGVLGVVGVGYVSATLTRGAAENATVQRMADEFGVLYVSSYNLPVWRIIERSNVKHRVYEYERSEARELVGWDSEPVPHWKDTPSGVDVLIVRGRTWPFVVSVERQCYEANLSAGGETSFYLAFFGLPLHICTFERWVS